MAPAGAALDSPALDRASAVIGQNNYIVLLNWNLGQVIYFQLEFCAVGNSCLSWRALEPNSRETESERERETHTHTHNIAPPSISNTLFGIVILVLMCYDTR
jgi:hypothetical protein